MAIDSIDRWNRLSETDLFSTTMSRTDSFRSETSSIDKSDRTVSEISEEKIHYKNLPGAMPISFNQMIQTQNSNAPWLINACKKKFSHRSRLSKKHSRSPDQSMQSTDDHILDKPISIDGTSGKWMVNETDLALPLIKDGEFSTDRQYNVSRAMSSSTSAQAPSTDESLHLRHYHYDFQTLITPTSSSFASLNHQQNPIETKQASNAPELSSIVSRVKRFCSSVKEEIDQQTCSPELNQSSTPSATLINHEIKGNDVPLMTDPRPIQTRSKRAKSSSAVRTTTKRGKVRSASSSTKKKTSKYYQEHHLTAEEIELREALRIIDLDNVGFFPPNEFRQVLKDIGISSSDIDKIEHCLPLDEDGHYSIDNLIRLFLSPTD